jgi:sulfur-carrier protein
MLDSGSLSLRSSGRNDNTTYLASFGLQPAKYCQAWIWRRFTSSIESHLLSPSSSPIVSWHRFFPLLENRTITVPAGSVAEVLREVNSIAPGFTDYVLDEHGALRRHVQLSIDDVVVLDRKTLTDRVPDHGTLYIFQSLSGG